MNAPSHVDDALRPARGITDGALLGLLIWCAILAAVSWL